MANDNRAPSPKKGKPAKVSKRRRPKKTTTKKTYK